MSSTKPAPESLLGATERSNSVSFLDISQTITGANYVDNSVVITAGQTASPPPAINFSGGGGGNGVGITLEAGREGSSDVANSFNSACGGSNNEYSPVSSIDSTPSDLNFYFQVNLMIGTTPNPVYLGQGSFGLTNNWWIGGRNVTMQDGPQIILWDGTTSYTFQISGDEDHFVLSRS